jgi:hypothetical protein
MIYGFHSNNKNEPPTIISMVDTPPELKKETLATWIKKLKPTYIVRIA